jgi:hypothetical protein
MSTRLHKPNSDKNVINNNVMHYLNGDHEYFSIVTNGNNPPTVKANTRFMVYKTTTYTISNDYATGNNEYIQATTPTILLNEVIFEPSDETFTWNNGTDFPAQSDGTWYLYCRGCLDTNATTVGKGSYWISKTDAPAIDYKKGGYYNTADGLSRCLASFVSTSGVVSALSLYKVILPYTMGTSGQIPSSNGLGGMTWVNPSASALYPISNIAGTIVHAADTDHDITFGITTAVDSTNTYVLQTAAPITRQVDAEFGTGNGGMYVGGTVAPSTVYYAFAIRKDSDGTINIYYDTSATALHIPTGHTYYAMICIGVTDSSSNWIQGIWTREGRKLKFKSNALIVERAIATAANTSRILVTHNMPVDATGFFIYRVYGSSNYFVTFGETHETDVAPTSTDTSKVESYTLPKQGIPQMYKVDSNKQTYFRVESTNVYIGILSEGWYYNL